MTNIALTTTSADQTLELGERLAHALRRGDTVVLAGDLAAGKTVFAKGIAAGLGIEPSEVTSPAYDLVHEYRGGALPLFHLDFYRLDELSQSDAHWIEEYLSGDGVSVVEWGEKFPLVLPADYLLVRITILGDHSRRLTFQSVGQLSETLNAEVSRWHSSSE